VDHRKLGRTAAHRRAMLNNMVTSLFRSERITTTDAKAKEARRLAERLITRAKKGYAANQDGDTAGALAHWRQAARYVKNPAVLRKLFEQIAPQYLERNGGYTRTIKMGFRLGDNARTVLLELVDTEVTVSPLGAARAKSPDGKKLADATGKSRGRGGAKSKAAAKKGSRKPEKKAGTKSADKPEKKGRTKSKSAAGAKSKRKAKAKG